MRGIDLSVDTAKESVRAAARERFGADPSAFKSFEDAFDGHSGSCVMRCSCGRRFYNPDGGWDWEDGELEELRADPNATALEWAAGSIEFEGRQYVTDCTCWHARAKQIIGFLKGHDREIAEFLTLERARLLKAAEASPVVR